MIQGRKFDFKGIIENFEITNKKIDINNKNILRMKNIFKSCSIVGLIFGVIFVVCGLILILFDNSGDYFSGLFKIFLFVFLMGTILVYWRLNSIMDLSSYSKLKKISKKEHVVYKYVVDIKSIYSPRVVPVTSELDSMHYHTDTERHRYGMSAGNVLIVNNQKIYLFDDTYSEIMLDKKIILYIVKYQNDYVLYDYERITNQQ